MRIFLISSEPYGFPEAPLLGVFQKDLKEALDCAGHEVIVLSPSGRSLRRLGTIMGAGRPSTLNGVIRNDTINFFPRFRPLEMRMFLSEGQRQFKKAASSFGKPDVIHAHNAIYAGFLAQALSKRHRIPFVLTEHSSWILKNSYRGDLKRRIDECYEDADQVVAVSENLKSVLQTEYGVADCAVIPNILPSEFYGTDPSAVRKEATFINVGSLDANKNQAQLIKAFARLLPEYPGARLILVGDGPARTMLADLAKSLNVENDVVFRGQITRDKVLEEFEKSTAFVLSSLFETFGVVVIEAMATGLPVIATPCGGPEGIIEPGVNGLLARGSDGEAIYQAMCRFLETEDTFDRKAIAMSTREQYSPKEVASKTVAIYKSVQAG